MPWEFHARRLKQGEREKKSATKGNPKVALVAWRGV